MAAAADEDVALEIGHVLFIDIVAYSKLTIDAQRAAQRELNNVVRGTEQFAVSERAGALVRLPTGDGMALVFRDDVEAPVRCAVQIARALNSPPRLPLRMGIHSGPVSEVTDVNERANVAGDGMNIAQRVMDCGDAGHILLSKRVADDLRQFGRWRSQMHDLGTVEVKHGVKIDIFNLAADDVGNLTLPRKVAHERAELALAAKRSHARRRMFIAAATGAAVLAVILSVVAYRMRRQLSELTAIPERSVAVLPFENLSADPKNALFVTGVQDEILTRSAKIAALKVIARTSTQQYQPRPANLRNVGKELGVAHILEGTVQIVGQQVRLNVQLIKAATAAHIWAETYDRDLTDLFAVESDVAARIASSLRAALSPAEEQRLKVVPTRNPDAYEAYLQGREYLFAAVYTPENDRKEKALYERAIQLDPEFALAHVALSTAYSYDALDNGVTTENRTKSRAEADEALRLQPDLGEAHFAKGCYYYRVERNYDSAASEFALALQASPNDGELLRSWGMMERRRGHWRKALELVQSSVAIDPRNMLSVRGLADLYLILRDYAVAEATRRREVDLATTAERAEEARWNTGVVQWVRTGRTSQLHEQLEHLPADYPPNQRGYRLAELGALERNPEMIVEGIDLAHDERPVAQWEKAQALFHKGNTARAQVVLDPLIAAAEALVKENPKEAKYHAELGLRYAYRGRKEDAIREGRRAVELLPESKDAFEGPGMETNLAKIYARIGEPAAAIDLLEHILTIPADLHRRELQVYMEWDPLRGNPRFDKLVGAPDAKITLKE